MRKYTPEVVIDLAYKNTHTGEIILQTDVRKLPVKDFKKPQYEPLYEIASVKVITSAFTYALFSN